MKAFFSGYLLQSAIEALAAEKVEEKYSELQ